MWHFVLIYLTYVIFCRHDINEKYGMFGMYGMIGKHVCMDVCSLLRPECVCVSACVFVCILLVCLCVCDSVHIYVLYVCFLFGLCWLEVFVCLCVSLFV